MAKKRVIVYYMHEAEQAAALKAMPSASVTDSFAIGEIEESDENALRKEGLVVQDQQVATAEDFPSVVRKATASAIRYEIAPGAQVDSVPAPVDYYLIQLRGPILEEWRKRLAAINVTLLELIPRRGYKTRLNAEQVPALTSLDFVESVTWIGPEQSAPATVTEELPSAGRAPAAGIRMLTFDVRLNMAADLPKIQDWL